MAAKKKASIFLSYSRRDSEFVDRLAAALDARGYAPLVDRADISGGEAWRERLEQLILQADAVAFVISPDSISSPVCEWEIARTLELGKRLIPLCLRQVDVAPEALSRLNYIFFDANSEFQEGFSRFCNACDIDIDWVREHTRYTGLAARWIAGERGTDALLRGAELAAAENWLSARAPAAPDISEALTSFLQAARTDEVKRLRRTKRTQILIGGLVALAAVFVLAGGAVTARLFSGIGERSSLTLAERAREASDQFVFDRAARFAVMGLVGADWPLLGHGADPAEVELRRALTGPLHAVLSGHDGAVIRVSFSADGARVLTVAGEAARIWDTESGQVAAILRTQSGVVLDAAFSPDGARVVTGASGRARETPSGLQESDGDVGVWDAMSGRQLLILHGFRGSVRQVAFSPDGERIFAASLNGIRVWDATTGRALFNVPGFLASFSPDGRRIVSTNGGAAFVWDALDGRPIATLQTAEESLSVASFSPDSARVITGGRASTGVGVGRIWEATSGRLISVLRGHGQMMATGDGGGVTIAIGSAIAAASFSPDGARVVTASWDGTAIVWEAATGRPLFNMRGHVGEVLSATFSPDGSRILTSARDGLAVIWESRFGNVVAVLRKHDGAAFQAAFSRDGQRVVTGSADSSAIVWEIKQRQRIVASDSQIAAAWIGSNDIRVAIDTDDARVRIVDGSGAEVAMLSKGGGSGEIDEAVFSADGALFLASLRGSSTVRLWEIDSQRERRFPVLENERIDGFGLGSDGRRLVIWLSSDDVQVRDVETADVVAILNGGERLASAALNADGSRVLLMFEDGVVRVFDVATAAELVVLRGHEEHWMRSGAFSPDGRRIATASDDETVRVWDAETGTSVAVMRGHREDIHSVRFSADGRYVISSSEDQTIRIWEAESGREVMVLTGHVGDVEFAMLSADNASVISTSWDQTARLWTLPSALTASRRELIAMACSGPLRGSTSRFNEFELQAAPVIDPVLDADSCAPAGTWRRLTTYLGLNRSTRAAAASIRP